MNKSVIQSEMKIVSNQYKKEKEFWINSILEPDKVEKVFLPYDYFKNLRGVIKKDIVEFDIPEHIVTKIVKTSNNVNEIIHMILVSITYLLVAKYTDKNDIIADVFKSKAILVGSPTIGKGILSSIAEIMELIKGLRFKNKKAASFGCYGWSGESIKILKDHLEKSGFSIINEGIRAMWNPDDESIAKCIEFGREIARQI